MELNILLVSHSADLAKATQEFIIALAPANKNVCIYNVGGTDDGEFGNSFNKIKDKLEKLKDKKTLVFPDLGSAVLITKTILDSFPNEFKNVEIVDAAFVEGAFTAYSSFMGNNLEETLKFAKEKITKQS